MQSTSELYKALFAAEADAEHKAVVSGVEYGMDSIVEQRTVGNLFADNEPGVGGCLVKEFDLSLLEPGAIPRMAKIELYCRLAGGEEQTYMGEIPVDAPSAYLTKDQTYYIGFPEMGRLSFVADDWYSIHALSGWSASVSMRIVGGSFLSGELTLQTYDGRNTFTFPLSADVPEEATDAFHGYLTFSLTGRKSPAVFSEWLPKGVFYIDTRAEDSESGVLTLHGYDAMLKTEQSFTSQGEQGTWPRKDIDVVDEVCRRIGVTLDARTRAILTQGFLVQYPGIVLEDGTPQYDKDGAYSVREVLGYIGSMYAGNWITSDAGELRLVVLGEPAENTDLGRSVSKLDIAPAFDAYSKVVVIAGEDADGNQLVYEAGDDTGLTLEVENPWGTQAVANYILAQIEGYVYQPFTAAGALLDPAAALGDGVTVSGVSSVLAQIDTSFSVLTASDVSAPCGGEVDHEYPYTSGAMKQLARKLAETTVSLTVDVSGVVAQVQNLATQTNAKFSVLDGQISGLVSTVDAQGETLSAGVSLDASGVLISNQDGQRITIDAQNLAISFSQLTDAQTKQLEIDAANAAAASAQSSASSALSAASAVDTALYALKTNLGYTYINGEYVISPNIVGADIYGGRYWNRSGGGAYTQTNDTGWADWGLYYANGDAAFEIVDLSGISSGAKSLRVGGTPFLVSSGATTEPYGSWNFSHATVTGLYLRFTS